MRSHHARYARADREGRGNGGRPHDLRVPHSRAPHVAGGRGHLETELTERLYDQDFERDSNVIEVLVGRLRRKLDPQDELKPIETLRGGDIGSRWRATRPFA